MKIKLLIYRYLKSIFKIIRVIFELRYHPNLIWVRLKHKFLYFKLLRKISQSEFFDKKYYLQTNPDVWKSGMSPVKHYLLIGGYEGRNPGQKFHGSFYISNYPDVIASGLNPLIHYLEIGIHEKRIIKLEDPGLTKYGKTEYFEIRRNDLVHFLKSNSIFEFNSANARISIIIVLFNQAELTLGCIKSIAENAGMPIELIIIDNNSTDQTKKLIRQIEGATIIQNPDNLHFLEACNQALELVTTEYILFLNNDAELLNGSLIAALNAINDYSDIGAVGGKIILPDGTLQEAGCTIWKDGSCSGYGRGFSPLSYEYNFRRVVDYCSGAFLLTKTKLFKEHGGFDNHFKPAYYEETDYCLWLQEMGLKVVYVPEAAIRHFEFASSAMSDAVALQETNKEKFINKHTLQLQNHFPNFHIFVIKARFAASLSGSKRILYIDDRVPHKSLGMGFPRSNTIIKCMRELGYEITIFPSTFPDEENWPDSFKDIDPYIEIAKGFGHWKFSEFIKNRKDYYDLIWVSRSHNLTLLKDELLKLVNKTRIIYDAEAINTEREIHKQNLENGVTKPLDFMEKLEQELTLPMFADLIIAVSKPDAAKFISRGMTNTIVLGHTLNEKPSTTGYHDRHGILFIGNLDHEGSPNVDSILWFIQNVFPIIQKALPEVVLNVAGTNKAQSIKDITHKNVIIHGFVDDLTELINQNRIFIAPTRFAAGIPFKIHEASSFGLPTVTTRLLQSQLGWDNNEHLIVADADPQDFASKTIDLYTQEELWNRIHQGCLGKIASEHTYHEYKKIISDSLTSLISPKRILGSIDSINDHNISGWAILEDQPDKTVNIGLTIDYQVRTNQKTGIFRQDVARQFGTNGNCGFNIPLPLDLPYNGQVLNIKVENVLLKTRFRNLIKESPDNHINTYAIFGERASGTNYLNELFSRNFPNVPYTPNYGWKHSVPKIDQKNSTQTLILAIFREPFDWLRSLYMQPYHVHHSITNLSFSEFIRAEWHCIYDEQAKVYKGEPLYGTEMIQERNPETGERFENILKLRTSKIKSWKMLMHEIQNIECLLYENINADPKSFITSLKEKYNLSSMPGFIGVDTYKGISETIYSPKKYFKILKTDYDFILQNLDFEVEESIGYSMKDFNKL